MKQATGIADAVQPPSEAAPQHREQRLERLIDRLPSRLQTTTWWLRQPSLRWVRVPAGVLLIGGSFLSILPFFGLWMLPLGLMLLAEDIPLLRRVCNRALDWIEWHRPHWFNTGDARAKTQAPPTHSSTVAGRASCAGPHQ